MRKVVKIFYASKLFSVVNGAKNIKEVKSKYSMFYCFSYFFLILSLSVCR